MIKNIIERAKATRVPFRVIALIMALVVLCAGTVFAASGETYIVDIYEGSQITRVETTLKDAYAVVEEAKINSYLITLQQVQKAKSLSAVQVM